MISETQNRSKEVLECLFSPASVAIVGASAEPRKWGHLLARTCSGVLDRAAELELAPWLDVPAGEIGLIAQSGNLAAEVGLFAAREGLGFSRFASIGNQADLEAADLLENLAAHDSTRLI